MFNKYSNELNDNYFLMIIRELLIYYFLDKIYCFNNFDNIFYIKLRLIKVKLLIIFLLLIKN